MNDRRDPAILGGELLRLAEIHRSRGTDLRTSAFPEYDDPAPLAVVAEFARGTLEDHVPRFGDAPTDGGQK